MSNKSSLIPTYVFTEMTPNPNGLKFVADRAIVPAGMVADFSRQDEEVKNSLVAELFGFPFVQGLFLMNNFVTVTKDEATDWDIVKHELREFIQRYLMQNDMAISAEQAVDMAQMSETLHKPLIAEHKVNSELERKIADLLDEYVKPAVERDGGMIQLHSFQEGTVTVELRGACSGCPSSTQTLKDGIENLLKSMLPEVQQVVARS